MRKTGRLRLNKNTKPCKAGGPGYGKGEGRGKGKVRTTPIKRKPR